MLYNDLMDELAELRRCIADLEAEVARAERLLGARSMDGDRPDDIHPELAAAHINGQLRTDDADAWHSD